jgi:HlyD family secretion protein
MTANVKVSESLSGRIRQGQRALIRSDAMPTDTIQGEVLGVSVLAEGGGWRDPNRRDYTVRILLSDAPAGLKPSMRCKAEVFVDHVDSVLSVPIQSIFRKGPLTFVYVPSGSGYAQQKVSIGRSSELKIEVLDGLEAGDTVLLREPPTEEIVSRLEVPAEARPAGGDGRPGMPTRESARRPGAGEKPDSAAAPKGDIPAAVAPAAVSPVVPAAG